MDVENESLSEYPLRSSDDYLQDGMSREKSNGAEYDETQQMSAGKKFGEVVGKH